MSPTASSTRRRSGEVTANQVDANFNRLGHLHDDLEGAITTIVNNNNANRTSIINNANVNTTTIVANDNTNTATIITNDNTNTATIITNANANKNELRDLILRSQIEADLAMVDALASSGASRPHRHWNPHGRQYTCAHPISREQQPCAGAWSCFV
jgi:hypothetical protein